MNASNAVVILITLRMNGVLDEGSEWRRYERANVTLNQHQNAKESDNV